MALDDDRFEIPAYTCAYTASIKRKGLRDFSLVTSGVIVGLFGLMLPWVFGLAWPIWPWIIAAILTVLGIVAPLALGPVYKRWMQLGLILNRITTPIIMGLVFFLVVTPMGLIRRLFSEDILARNFDDEDSYRVPSKKAKPENMGRPF